MLKNTFISILFSTKQIGFPIWILQNYINFHFEILVFILKTKLELKEISKMEYYLN